MTAPDTARALTLAGLLTLAATQVATARDSHRCATIADDPARLACYDAAFGKPSSGTAETHAVPDEASPAAAVAGAGAAAKADAPDAANRARAEFGLSETEKRARKPEQDAEPASISGEVARIGRRPTGELVVSLADGQVWTAIEPDARTRVKAGDSVTIRKATLGSYLLVGPDRIAVRVRRLK